MKWFFLLYEVALLAGFGFLFLFPNAVTGPLIVQCGVAGGIGGALYCLRGLYLNVRLRP